MTILVTLRRTSPDKFGGSLRILVGFVFFLAGILKVVVPSLGAAFSGQLDSAGIPFPGLVLYTFPIIEMVLGILLLAGIHARITAAIAALSMVVATYVHIAVDDPSLFPLQPVEPIGPLMLLAMLIYTVFRGGGTWSIDLKECPRG